MTKPEPAHANVSYGPHRRQVLDLWQADGDRPAPLLVWFHGGGFTQGTKANIPNELIVDALAAGISVASVEYRLTDEAAYPAAFEDGARAVQFLRHNAAKYRIDPARIAAGGASAGGGIALWIGLRDDPADPKSDDPVARQSIKLAALVCINAQSSYDPAFIRQHIPGPTWRSDIIAKLFAAKPEDFEKPELKAQFADASPINFVNKNDPPAFLFYSQPDTPPGQEVPQGPGIHHVRFGQLLKAKLDAVGVRCTLRTRADYPNWTDQQMWPTFSKEAVAFLNAHLSRN